MNRRRNTRKKRSNLSRRIHSHHSKSVVLFNMSSIAGFGSVFFFMIHAYIYAKKTNTDFRIKNDGWAYTYDKGWRDYFDSLTDYDPAVKYSHIKHTSHSYNVTNYDKVMKGDHKKHTFHFKNLKIPDYSFKDYSDAVQEVFKPKQYIQELASRAIATMNGPYVAIYVRRGDKVSGETAEMDAVDLETVIAATGIESGNVFVMTDDYRVVNEIRKLLPNCDVSTLTPSKKKGSFQGNIASNTPENKKSNAEELFSSIEVFHNATQGWADGRSNMGRFLKLRDPAKVTLYSSDEVSPDTIIQPWYIFTN